MSSKEEGKVDQANNLLLQDNESQVDLTDQIQAVYVDSAAEITKVSTHD